MLAASTVASLSTLRAGPHEVAQAVAAWAFFAGVATGPVVVIGVRRSRRRGAVAVESRSDRQWIDAMPSGLFAFVLACWLVLGGLALTGFAGLGGGAPERRNDRFVLNDHGDISEVTVAEYNAAVAGEVRLSAAVAGVFLGASTLIAGTRGAQLRSNRSGSDTTGPSSSTGITDDRVEPTA